MLLYIQTKTTGRKAQEDIENERYKFDEKLRKNKKKGIDFFSELSIIIFVR